MYFHHVADFPASRSNLRFRASCTAANAELIKEFMVKFIYKSIAALILIAAFAACNKKQNLALQDGTFFGSGAGRNGTINVSVTIADGKITDAKILSESETPEIGRAAEESFIEQLLQYGSTNKIDVISGATLTYNALCDAFEDALNAARNIQPDEIS